jgi:hypothetical protein
MLISEPHGRTSRRSLDATTTSIMLAPPSIETRKPVIVGGVAEHPSAPSRVPQTKTNPAVPGMLWWATNGVPGLKTAGPHDPNGQNSLARFVVETIAPAASKKTTSGVPSTLQAISERLRSTTPPCSCPPVRPFVPAKTASRSDVSQLRIFVRSGVGVGLNVGGGRSFSGLGDGLSVGDTVGFGWLLPPQATPTMITRTTSNARIIHSY